MSTAVSPAAAPASPIANLDESVQRVAVAGVLKDKAVKAAKDVLAEGAAHTFDFKARFTGHISKGFSVTGQESTAPATCSLVSKAIFAELLRRAEVSPADLRRHLKAIVRASLKANPNASIGAELTAQNGELQQVFDAIALAAAAELPARVIPASTQAARVSVTGTCEFLSRSP